MRRGARSGTPHLAPVGSAQVPVALSRVAISARTWGPEMVAYRVPCVPR